jgi:hypothetical protein
LGKKGNGIGPHEDFLGGEASQPAKCGNIRIIFPLMVAKHALKIPLLNALFSPEEQAEKHRLDKEEKNEIMKYFFSGHQNLQKLPAKSPEAECK